MQINLHYFSLHCRSQLRCDANELDKDALIRVGGLCHSNHAQMEALHTMG